MRILSGMICLWMTISCAVGAADAPNIGLTKEMWNDSVAAVETYKKEAHMVAGASGMYLYFLSSAADGTKIKVSNFWYASNIGADFKATFGDANQKMVSSINVDKAETDGTIKLSCKITRQGQGTASDVNFFEVKLHPLHTPQVIGGVPDGKSGKTFIVVEYFDSQ